MSFALAFRPFALAVLMLAGVATAAFPQAEEDVAFDPPGRVGRLSHMEGTVSFRNNDENQWVPATLNFPVTTGDSLWTEPNSRAEIQIGSLDLRLDQMTAIQIPQLDDQATQIQVDQGTINLRVREVPPGGVRIVAPRTAINVLQPGRYHVDVSAPQGGEPGDEVRIAVLEGAASIDGLASPLTVTAGHSATLHAGENFPMLAQAIALPIDNWALERERALAPRQALQYVSPEMTGVQGLDTYGRWATEPTYGAVWYPQAVPVDWAPYRYGYWAYVRPWGWTWVDDAPWGFAPFHYGRWVRVRDRWGWCPGTRVHRPVYAPALVAFAGGGASFAIFVTGGGRAPAVGWVPLGPYEVYRPTYRHSPRYVRNINVTNVNVTNITVINNNERDSFRSLRNRDAATVVSAASFTGAVPVSKARVQMRDDDISNAPRAASLDHLRPSRSARAGAVVPAVATSNAVAAPSDVRQRSRRGDDDRTAPPALARPAQATGPARDPDVLPQAPGPNRTRTTNVDRPRDEQQRPDSGTAAGRQDRQPAVSPLNRSDRAAPALRMPETPASAAPAMRTPQPPAAPSPTVRTPEPPGRASNPAVTSAPASRNPGVTNPGVPSPGVTVNRPAEPPGRAVNPNRDTRERRDGGRDNRPPTAAPNDDARSAPRVLAPQAPRQVAPSQMPGTAPNTVAPTRPQAVPPVESRRESGRPESRRDSPRPNTDQGRDEPRVLTPPAQPRSQAPSRSPEVQRAVRPEQPAPQRVIPPQPRREEREARREPMRQESPRTTIVPPQNVERRAPQQQQQQPMRQIAPQSAERRAPQAAPAPSRPQQQDATPRRSESQGRGRGQPQDGNLRRPD